MNLRIITKNHAADPEKGFLKKSISKPYGRATAMPTAWELNAAKFREIPGTGHLLRPNRYLLMVSQYQLKLCS